MAQAKKPLDVGSKAPRFRLQDQDGETTTAKDLDGVYYVFFFYPKASTPGCTQETCDFRDARSAFEQAGVHVFGVSPDPAARQAKFHLKYEVTFPLLCDTDHALAEAYGCWKEKKLYGKTYMGIVRSAFLIDGKGKIAGAFYKVSPKNTPVKLLAALEGIEA